MSVSVSDYHIGGFGGDLSKWTGRLVLAAAKAGITFHPGNHGGLIAMKDGVQVYRVDRFFPSRRHAEGASRVLGLDANLEKGP